MFQYAMVRRISLQLGVPMKIDLSIQQDRAANGGYTVRDYDLGLFSLPEHFLVAPRLLDLLHAPRKRKWSNLVRKGAACGMPILHEKQFTVQQSLVDTPPDGVIYRGFWQSERYFASSAAQIKEDFQFKAPLLPSSLAIGAKMETENAVCLNVRRGETLQMPMHNVTDESYYLAAIEDLIARVPGAIFFIFSDDLPWCQSVFSGLPNVEFVGATHYGHRYGNYLQLMTRCRHFIIPNSTFAWWAAWLGEKKRSYIYTPQRWFGTDELNYSDVVPERWLRIPN
jgi:hypothetical protein